MGRDRYRRPPDPTRLPRVGEAIKFEGLSDWEAALVAGWGAPEPVGRWTVWHEAVVAWQVDGEADDLMLTVDGSPFLAGEMQSQEVEVWANDRLIRTLRYTRDQMPPLPVHIPLRRTERGILYITFLVRNPRSPAELGLSSDHRALGFNVRQLALLPASEHTKRLPRIGDTLDLSDASADQAPFEQGWSAAEPTGRWTVGREAAIAWLAEPGDGELSLTCDGHAFVEGSMRSQNVEIWVDDRRVAEWRFDEHNTSIPDAPVLFARPSDAGVVLVRFKIGTPSSPAELGLSSDARALGLHIRRLTIAPSR